MKDHCNIETSLMLGTLQIRLDTMVCCPNYTNANKVSMQVAEAQPTILDGSSLEGCTTQCSLFQLC